MHYLICCQLKIETKKFSNFKNVLEFKAAGGAETNYVWYYLL